MSKIVLKISLIICILITCTDLRAIKATSNIVKIIQPDGTYVAARVSGDEFFGYLRDLNGYIVAQGADGYVYYANYDDGKLNLTSVRAASAPGSAVRGAGRNIPFSLLAQAAYGRMERNRRYREFKNRLPAARTVSGHSPLTVRTPVLLVQFKDIKFTLSDPPGAFDRQLNQKGYARGGATGSAADYFNDNFTGTATFEFDVYGVYTLSEDAQYYGAQSGASVDIRPGEMAAQACRLAWAAGVDFSRYDADGDGCADRVIIIFAGYNQAEGGPSYTLWPHHADIGNKNLVLNGVKISSYACASELKGASGGLMAGIGVFCHEFAHFFGLPDFYDINGEEEGLSRGFYGSLSLMDEGNFLNQGRTPPYLNAVERELLGLAVIEDPEKEAAYTLESVSGNRILRIGTLQEGEYFLLECRSRSGWDAYVGGEGLIVYHLDKSGRNVGGLSAAARWKYNVVNSYAAHPCARVIAAGGKASVSVPSVFYPGTAFNTELSFTSVPALADWNEKAVGIKLSGISYYSGKAAFRTMPDMNYDASLPAVSQYTCTPYQHEIRLSWKPAFMLPDSEWKIDWRAKEEDQYTHTLTTGSERCLIEGLLPDKEYAIRICCLRQNGMGEITEFTCTTDPVSSDFPFMRIKGYYSPGERIDLKIYNLPSDCTGITWKVNGVCPPEPCWEFKEAGEYFITAALSYEDGSCDIITKVVTVK